MKNLLFTCLLALTALYTHSQTSSLYRINKDSSLVELTPQGASLLASLPLKCIVQQYPNKTGHTVLSDSDQLVSAPRQLHPIFYGCFDWHSSVHGHWMLVSLLKMFPQLPEAAAIRKAINERFTTANIGTEVKYFDGPLEKGWERTYGWAWLLKLDEALYGWKDPDGERWHQLMQPLTQKIIGLWTNFLPKQTYPNRTGVHPNTAFGLVFALGYARTVQNKVFEQLITASAKRLYQHDINAPTQWEPDGSDFLSPSLEEADLMRYVLPANAFANWLNRYISPAGWKHLAQLPVVADRTDLQIVHLDGLSFSRSWCMRHIAAALPAANPRKKQLRRAAVKHLTAALPNVVSGNYGGEHWLASFALLALLQ